MAIVKFVTSGSPMNNIFPYIMKEEKTEQKLISGINCMPETAMEEFINVKKQFGKTDGRQYYHVVQSFSPEDNISPETAHEIGLKFAGYFGNYQMVIATHTDRKHIHNHIVFNSVNFESGKKFHQSRDEMIQVKEYSNKICQKYGLTLTEAKATRYDMPKWKRKLKSKLEYAMKHSRDKEEFIYLLERLGVTVNILLSPRMTSINAEITSYLMRDFSKKISKSILNLAVAIALFQKNIRNMKHRRPELSLMIYSS